MKIETAIKEGYLDLKNKNIKSALLDSEILMSKAIKENRSNVLLNPDRILITKILENLFLIVYNLSQLHI